jgi:hypothetical protein
MISEIFKRKTENWCTVLGRLFGPRPCGLDPAQLGTGPRPRCRSARARGAVTTRDAHGGALVGLQQESPGEVPGMVAGRGTHPLGGVTVRVEVMAYSGVHWRRVGSGGW